MPESLPAGLRAIVEMPVVAAAAIIALSILAARAANWIVTNLLKRWARKSATTVDDRVIALAHKPIYVTVVLAGCYWAAQVLTLPARPYDLVVKVLATIAVVVWGGLALGLLRVLIDVLSGLEDRFRFVQPSTAPLIRNVGQVVLFGAAVYFLFLAWGIDVTAWLASAGIIGIAVGFAAKDTLANLFGGVFILVDAPYQLGDYIVLDSGERGQVTHVGLRSTRLLTRDDVEVTIPNAVIANAKIVNESGGPWVKYRIRIKIGVAYGSDVDHVRAVLMDVANANDEVVPDPAARVRFRAFGESSLDFELLGWIAEPSLRGRVTDELLTAIYKRFQAEAIEIPYPKRDVYVKELRGGPPEIGANAASEG